MFNLNFQVRPTPLELELTNSGDVSSVDPFKSVAWQQVAKDVPLPRQPAPLQLFRIQMSKHHQVPPVGLASGRVPKPGTKRRRIFHFNFHHHPSLDLAVIKHKSSHPEPPGGFSFRPFRPSNPPFISGRRRPIFLANVVVSTNKPPNANSKSIKFTKNNSHFQLLSKQ